MRSGQRLVMLLALSLVALGAVGCSRKVSIDWSAKENFFVVETSGKNEDDSVRLEYHSLVDAPADAVYAALAAPEDYVIFLEGVSDSGKISASGNSRVIHITQNVIGRQTRAQIKYTFHPEQKKLEFETVQSDSTFNTGSHEVTPSPDGKRCYVISIYNVREKAGQKMPPGVLTAATRETFAQAARSVKARALGGNVKAPKSS